MTILEQLSVLDEIASMVESISDAAIAHADSKQRSARDEKEKPLGTIHNEACKRLWVSILKFRSESKAYEAQADASENEIEEKELRAKSNRADTLGRLSKELFWAQVQEDLNFHGDIGIRAGWMAVEMSEREGPPPGILGGLIGFSGTT